MKKYFFAIPLIAALVSCTQHKALVKEDDYAAFLQKGKTIERAEYIGQELSFWEQRLQRDTGNYVDMLEMARCCLQLFSVTGEIDYLSRADSLLKRSSGKLNNSDPDILFALSQASVTQHRFHDAAAFNEAADRSGGSKFNHQLIAFDVSIELGDEYGASRKLNTLADRNSFDYLLRKSKLEDRKGNTAASIRYMEQAFEKVKDKKNALSCWALSNLGDMYGHAGRVAEAYRAYLAVLAKDSNYLHALKGIAWLAFSHDKNAEAAKTIIEYILSETQQPDLLLMLADIEDWQGNSAGARQNRERFIREIAKPVYGGMYNKYLIRLFTDEMPSLEKALALAKSEIKARATPETYDWLAWVHYNKGETTEAYRIAKSYVYRHNHEPDAQYHTALIFAASGRTAEAKKILRACLENSFELGPVTTKNIKIKLASL